ncbi:MULTISPECIES: TlpA family protein disulfide reductase [Marivita]|uniref:TlpA family protein disulfide reductase n=1 Tax=Marivita cryptomonadis TaxID=505252 RepID=A0A9Q2P3N4_9RHOB|nr:MULTISPECIES: TlpA disulfide reductase family protein [Marivita]MCR9167587.1 TlpA family protein disulfide reductase [Paracoccaceae bacterium]MBM2321968.1 TlpA family protein disulfide reductase [Marivita cryptomonadis]MBM2331405.1 TlpA family protein disulfide reductase [Marivita cryptomonadis]MBM2340991.1 TlpA family protein disulfide reductase [Marivita cryptomonadis]MBM2345653.1 TlpA family protein disulfide reductase [Marivita cryptomonadis]
MKKILAAILYTGLVTLANPALADLTKAEAMREGDMKKLTFHSTPQAAGTAEFTTFDGAPLSLESYKGKWVLLNFWATWCAPCRKEMPMLSELQTEFGGGEFEVVTVATGRNPPPAMQSFFDEIGVDNLPLHRDPKSGLAREMGVLGLPITVILNPEGQEIARMRGDADWASDNAKNILKTILGQDIAG